mmetsp:Transcript_22516/g.55013  ORF Transcript_22516/g.55013 Transcript_22516/m.55013 type:complete len:206 (+) Transcript_22516:611-1228(+)
MDKVKSFQTFSHQNSQVSLPPLQRLSFLKAIHKLPLLWVNREAGGCLCSFPQEHQPRVALFRRLSYAWKRCLPSLSELLCFEDIISGKSSKHCSHWKLRLIQVLQATPVKLQISLGFIDPCWNALAEKLFEQDSRVTQNASTNFRFVESNYRIRLLDGRFWLGQPGLANCIFVPVVLPVRDFDPALLTERPSELEVAGIEARKLR